MMKLIIIDDEPMIRRGIRTSIDWIEHGIDFCSEAKNGQEGLKEIRKHEPHIVLVDIRMPIMDGLAFSEVLKQEYPSIKIVILSGYNDFSYAQRALKIGVNEYLLKPVGAEELVNLVLKLSEKIRSEMIAIEETTRFEQMWNENLHIMRNHFINSILRGEFSTGQLLKDKVERLQIPVEGSEYQVVAIDIDDFMFISDIDDPKEREWILYSVENIAEEVLETTFSCVVYPGDFGGIIAFLNSHPNNRQYIIPLCHKMQSYVKKYVKLSITLGIGKAYRSLSEASFSYQQALTALREKVYRGKEKIIHYQNGGQNGVEEIAFIPTRDEQDMLYFLKSMDEEHLFKKLDKAFRSFEISRSPYQQVQTTCVKWLLQGVSQLEQLGVNIPKEAYSLKQPYEEIQKYETFMDLKKWLYEQFQLMISLMDDYKKASFKNIVSVAMRYVNEHYDEEIRLEDVANSAFVTQNYFSRVFKEETGEHFTLWLNKFRIEKAKGLLDDESLKIYEVSDKVGYNDYKYFAQMFKKYTGYTPKQYRKNRENTKLT